ncbi:uncharacterized protein LOC126681121 isoform X2 [Mercurialis annua]|uniref:uncharacterized protein LOC126681121 isoform X2 n=1 Tax=Mercurialis annua TaxID=3986 RepID=UPI00215DECF1|nr:uncharacterized protein LOC126681121 isoform X2 [Mercurialis annua]
MVSDSELVTRLREILQNTDLNTATSGSVRRKLQEDFGVDLSDKKAFIREQIDSYLETLDNDNTSKNTNEEEGENIAEAGEMQNGNGNDAVKANEEEEESEGQERSKKSEKEVKKRGGGGFAKPCSLSPQLQKVVGVSELARTQVVQKLWAYIRENNLQDPTDKRNIKCDKVLKDLFRVNTINMFKMNKVLSKHIWPLTPEAENEKLKAKDEDDRDSGSGGSNDHGKEEEEQDEVEEEKEAKEEDGDEEEEEEAAEIEDKQRRKKERSKKKEKEVKKRGGGGFAKLCSLSPKLQKLFGVSELARTEVVKRLWAYIRENNLQDPENRRNIKCDKALKDLFSVNSINMFQMNKVLSKHIWPLTPEAELTDAVNEQAEIEKLKAKDEDDEDGQDEEEEESNDPGKDEDGQDEEEEEKEEEKQKEEEEEDGDEEEEAAEKEDKKSSKKARSRKREKEVKKRVGGGFAKLCSLSPQLQKITGVPELARNEVVRKLWAYIRENSLQDPTNKRNIKCNEALRDLFGVNSINMFQMNKVLSGHIWPLTPESENEKLKAKDGKDKDSGSAGSNDLEKEEGGQDEHEEKKEEEEEDGDEEEEEEEKQVMKRSKKERVTKVDKDVKKRGAGFSKLRCSDTDETKQKEKRQKKGTSSLHAPLPLSDALIKFIGTGENELSCDDVVKRMSEYIEENDLQDPSDKWRIVSDDKLKELFEVDSFHSFSVSKLLTSHFIKLKE